VADDWTRGDLALCITSGTWSAVYGSSIPTDYPKRGHVYDVADVDFDDRDGELVLVLSPWLRDEWQASAFIKVTPKGEDEEDREVIEIMRGKQKEEVR